MTRPRIEPISRGPLANTLTIMPSPARSKFWALDVDHSHYSHIEQRGTISKNDSHDVVANMFDCEIEVSEFELLSSNYIHFWTGKGMNAFIPQLWLNSSLSPSCDLMFFYKEGFSIKYPKKFDMPLNK